MGRRSFFVGMLGVLLLCPVLTWASGQTILQDAATANGEGKNIATDDIGTVGMQTTISGTATVHYEGSVNGGGDWHALSCAAVGNSTFLSSSAATQAVQCLTSGLSHVRARIASCSACTVTVHARASLANSNLLSAALSGQFGTVVDSAPTLTPGAGTSFYFDEAGNAFVTMGTLLAGEDQNNGLIRTSGGAVRQTTVVSGVTTNTTSAATTVFTGAKTFYGQVVCSSGACVQTQAIYGDIDNDAANGILLCTLTLSATTRDQAACTVSAAPWSYYYVITTATSGTSATGAVYAMY